MKSLYPFATLLIILGVMALSFTPVSAPVAAPANSVSVSPDIIWGSDLVIWEGPPHEGPNIQVLPPEGRGGAGIQTTGLVFDVTWAGSWPTAAQNAFNYALNLWSTQLETTGYTVSITATWKSLGVGGPLGTGGPSLVYCTSGCPYNYTYYPTAFLDKLAMEDIMEGIGGFDIRTTYNSEYAADFYYGLDGNPAGDESDFVSVVLHEIGHGLGFTGGMWVDGPLCGTANNPPCYCGGSGNGCLYNGLPYIYDIYTEDSAGTSLLNYTSPSIALGSALKSNSLYFDGTNANAGNGGGRVPIYAPTTWEIGSSYSHLNYITYVGTQNSLMTYMLTDGDAFHHPGPVTLGIFEDIGWGMPPENYVYIPAVFK